MAYSRLMGQVVGGFAEVVPDVVVGLVVEQELHDVGVAELGREVKGGVGLKVLEIDGGLESEQNCADA